MKTTLPRINSCRSRFGLTHYPLPRGVSGKNFFDQTQGYINLEMYFQDLLDEPGLGVLTAETGIGKTAAIRNLCATLPEPNFKVIYICDTSVTAFDLYRTLALEFGIKPSHRRAQLWWDIKRTVVHLVEEQHTLPVIVLDEAQYLSDDFLVDLCGFLNYSFDSKTLLTLWLVGMPALTTRLKMRHHAPLASRIVANVRFEPLSRDDFSALIDHGFKSAGANEKLLTDTAFEKLWRACHGVVRTASSILRDGLRAAHLNNQNLLDDKVIQIAIDKQNPPQEIKP